MKGRRAVGAGQFLVAVLLGAAALLPSIARAELTLSAEAAYLKWKEVTDPVVEETGPLYGLGLAYTQNRDSGALFAYRGKLWGGQVDYEGATLFGGTPVTNSTSSYAGLGNELQARWRKLDGYLDGVLGAGLDVWRRSLSSVQKEDYAIAYLRLGVESRTDDFSKWGVSIGLKYPIWTYENAHLDDIGFDSNPILHPGGELSPYASLGYRLTPKLQFVAFYDGFRFSKSPPVQVNEVAQGLGPATVVQPASSMSIFGIRVEYLLR